MVEKDTGGEREQKRAIITLFLIGVTATAGGLALIAHTSSRGMVIISAVGICTYCLFLALVNQYRHEWFERAAWGGE